jgi:hypothetical protein
MTNTEKSIGALAFTSVPVVHILLFAHYTYWPHLSAGPVQARFASGLWIMEHYSALINKWPAFGFAMFLLAGLVFLISLMFYVRHAGHWRSHKVVSVFFFIACLAGFGLIEFILIYPIINSILRFQIALLTWLGPECWVSYVLTPLLVAACVFLAVATCASWAYALALTNISFQDRGRRFRFSYFSTTTLLIICGGLRTAFLMYGDNGRNLIQTFGLEDKQPPAGTVFIIGDPTNRSSQLRPIRIRLTAVVPQIKDPPIAIGASLENLNRVERWLSQHPLSLDTSCARWTLALGYLARWDVDIAYQWLHRTLTTMDTRKIEFSVLLVGPLKPERRILLDEWADKSKWVLSPGYGAALAGQFLRYGDRDKADQVQRAVLASNNPEAKTLLAQYLPSNKTVTTGIIRGMWGTGQTRPTRVGLFRASSWSGSPLHFASTIKALSSTDIRHFMRLIDSQNLKDDGSWAFKYLREGTYAVGFVFDSEDLPAGRCIQIRNIPNQLNLSKQQSQLDLGRIRMTPCINKA